MRLYHLKYGMCPSCGARIVTEMQRSQHCNGEWFESQTFKCGCQINYSPNFGKEVVEHPCPNSEVEKAKAANRTQASRKLVQYIKKLNVDQAFKDLILRDIDWRLYK